MFLGLLGFLAFIVFIVFGIMWIVSLVNKNGKAVRNILISVAGLVVMIIASAIGIGSAFSEAMNEVDSEPEQVDENNALSNEEEEEEENEDVNQNNENEAENEKEENENNENAEEENDDVPREHKSALNKAESYANTMDMSKEGIYDQLVSEYGENFPEDAAEYVMDNIEADWKENALNKPRSYADDMDMSDDAIFDQLVSEYGEQFTEEEAQYAIDNLEEEDNMKKIGPVPVYTAQILPQPSEVGDTIPARMAVIFNDDVGDFS